MGFWIYMTAVALLVPVILIAVGSYFRKHPPETANWFWGYRTKRSMQNGEAWRFANVYGGKLMVRTGWIMLAVSLAVMLLTLFRSDDVVAVISTVLIFCQVIPVLAVIPLVERKLRRQFEKDGKHLSDG